MPDAVIKKYMGLSLKREARFTLNGKEHKIAPYLPGPKLVEAVKLAQILQRPLLIKGEPGCGKSRLAEAVAYELFEEDYKSNYFEWHVKSSSKAQDGLFIINYLQRLSDANTREGGVKVGITLKKDANGIYKDKGDYVELGELGKAFQLTQHVHEKKEKIPPVILIDEIDKADIDFPNDLLLELDKMEFIIPEAKDENGEIVKIKAAPEFRPLIIITSNDEKPLPPALLRRCLFHYIEFEDIPLKDIVETNYASLPQDIIDSSVDHFIQWRNRIEKTGVSNKNITTSELLDWIKIINYYYQTEKLSPDFQSDQLPLYYAALLKDTESIKLFTPPPAVATTAKQNEPVITL